jgi:tetratricopeptide (TPR) repeat protein
VPEDEEAAVLIELGAALTAIGHLERAEAVLRAACALAEEQQHEPLVAEAKLHLAFLHSMNDSASVLAEELLGAALAAAAAFEAHGDRRKLAHAYRYAAEANNWIGNVAAAQEAYRRALEAARSTNDERAESEILAASASALTFGPTPADQAEVAANRIRAWGEAHGRLQPQATALLALGYAHALRGDFERARDASYDSLTLLRQTHPLMAEGFGTQMVGVVELLAGDIDAAETALLTGLRRLEQMGETGFLSTNAAMLAHIAHVRGDPIGAERFVELARESASDDDVLTQMLWRTALAKVRAAEEALGEAERLAREAVAIAARTDYIPFHADALVDLAAILRRRGAAADADARTEEAIRLYEAKGNVVTLRQLGRREQTRAREVTPHDE